MLQPVAFGVTALLAWAVFRPGAPSPSSASVALVLASAAVTGAIALWISAPPSWFAAVLFHRWAYPLLAVAVGALTWRAAAGAEELWGVLSETTLRGAAVLLRLLRADVTVGPEPDLIEVGDFAVVVTPVCSGADGLGLVVLLQATWIALARERLRVSRALLLIPLGMAVALGANMARIATLLWVGGSGHEDLAAGGLHSKLGWILFIGIALGSIALAERIPWFRRPSPEHHVEAGALPAAAAAYVAPLLAALVAALMTSIWSDGGLDRWYVARVLAAMAVVWLVRRDLPSVSIAPSWFPVVAGGILGAAWIALVPVDAAAGARFLGALQGLGAAERWALGRRPAPRFVPAHPGGGGAGVPRVPPPLAGLARVRDRPATRRDLAGGPPLVARVRGAPRPLGPGHAGRAGVCSRLDAARAPRRRDCRPRARQRQHRGGRAGVRSLGPLGLISPSPLPP